ncbi:hypothetical protein [Arthrobacter sp. SAFR-014]|uniref:hypothetical protein n=1 Tax=unclassified Arthrobacter TaxID=235627 RepID=UPI003F7B3E38
MQLVTGLLRTLVPALWGSLITWLIGVLPILAPMEGDLRGLGTVITVVVTAVIIGAWYAFWRWLEPRLPDWLTRAVLGSAKTPVYAGKHVAGSQTPAVNTIATLNRTTNK